MNLGDNTNVGADENQQMPSGDLSLSLTGGPWSPHSQSDRGGEDDKIKNWKAAGRAVRQILTQVNVQQLANDENTQTESLVSSDKGDVSNYMTAFAGQKYSDFTRTQYFPSLEINSTSDAMNEMLDEFKAKRSSNDNNDLVEDNQETKLLSNIKNSDIGFNNRQNWHHRNNILKSSKTINDFPGFTSLNCQSPSDSYNEKIVHSYSSTELSRMNDSSDTRSSFDCVLPSPLMSNGDDDSCDLERSRTLLEASFNDIQMDAVAEDKCITSDTITSRSNSVSNENSAQLLYGLVFNNKPCKDQLNLKGTINCEEHDIKCDPSESCDMHRDQTSNKLKKNKDMNTKSQWEELKEKIAHLTGKSSSRKYSAQDQRKSGRSQKGKSKTSAYFTKKEVHATDDSSSDSEESIKNASDAKPKRYSEHRKKMSKIQEKFIRNNVNEELVKTVQDCDSNNTDNNSQINDKVNENLYSSTHKNGLPPAIQLSKSSDFGDVPFQKNKSLECNNIPQSIHGRKSKQCINSTDILLKLNNDRIETLKTMMNVEPNKRCDCTCVNCDTGAASKNKDSIITSETDNRVNNLDFAVDTTATQNIQCVCSLNGGTPCKNHDKDIEIGDDIFCDKTETEQNSAKKIEKQLLIDLKHKNELLLTSNTKRLSGIRNSTNAKIPYISNNSSSPVPNKQNSNSFHTTSSPNEFNRSSPFYCASTREPHPFLQAVMRNVFPFNGQTEHHESAQSSFSGQDTEEKLAQCSPFSHILENENNALLDMISIFSDEEDNTELDSMTMPDLISSTDDEVEKVVLEMEHNTQQFRSPQSDQMENSDLVLQENCESDYGDDFTELHISSNIQSDEEEPAAIKISPRDIDSLPELLFSSDESKSGSEADDEFECDCAVCVTHKEENEDVESLPSLHEDLHNVSSDVMENMFEENVPGSYTMPNNSESPSDFELFPFLPFSIRLSELGPFDLLNTSQSRRDLLVIMFQNVFMQMLAVYPELLGDRAPPPLHPEDLSNIPVINIDESQIAKEAKCPICLCEFEKGEEARKLQCSHTFHNLCIEAWFAKSGTCPVCRDIIKSQQNQAKE